MKQSFYRCRQCGNVVALIRDGGVPLYCCGESMDEMIPGTTDGAQEKHVPVCRVEGERVTVSVGAAEHPMTAEHYIEWICLQTNRGSQHRRLSPNDPPKACFALCEGDKVETAYAFCNLHSLWSSGEQQ